MIRVILSIGYKATFVFYGLSLLSVLSIASIYLKIRAKRVGDIQLSSYLSFYTNNQPSTSQFIYLSIFLSFYLSMKVYNALFNQKSCLKFRGFKIRGLNCQSYIHLSISIYLFIYLSILLPIYLSIYSYVSIYIAMYLSIYLFFYLSVIYLYLMYIYTPSYLSI